MKSIGSNQWKISRALRAVFYSAEAQPSSSSSSSSSRRSDSLYQRIVVGVRDSKIPITPQLDQWLQEGQDVNQPDLHGLIKQLRKYHRHSHALQIQEWMTNKMNFELTPSGKAVMLDLIFKVHGLNKAEEYFNSVPGSLRSDKLHGALLNCYVKTKSLQKAEDLFAKMKDLGFAKSALSNNVMLTLYSQTGNQEKLNSLAREMEEDNGGPEPNTYTCNIQLNAYANSDVDAMESLLSKMESGQQKTLDFHGYFIAAKGYLKHGLMEKALTSLRKAEELIKVNGNRSDYDHLVTLYGSAGKRDEVYRIWEMCKKKGRASNTANLSVMSSLLKLEDIEGAEKILEEWERVTAKGVSFDRRIATLFVSLYCKKGLLDKALACVERFEGLGRELDAGIWQCVATQCVVEGRNRKAVEIMKKAISASGPKWRLNRSTLALCFEYLKREGDLDEAKEVLRLVRESGTFSGEVCERLAEFVGSDRDYGALAAFGLMNSRN